MNGRPRLVVLAAAVVFLRWLAVGHVSAMVGGVPVTVPALAVAAVAVTAAAVAVTALVLYRIRADRARLVAWRAGGTR